MDFGTVTPWFFLIKRLSPELLRQWTWWWSPRSLSTWQVGDGNWWESTVRGINMGYHFFGLDKLTVKTTLVFWVLDLASTAAGLCGYPVIQCYPMLSIWWRSVPGGSKAGGRAGHGLPGWEGRGAGWLWIHWIHMMLSTRDMIGICRCTWLWSIKNLE